VEVTCSPKSIADRQSCVPIAISNGGEILYRAVRSPSPRCRRGEAATRADCAAGGVHRRLKPANSHMHALQENRGSGCRARWMSPSQLTCHACDTSFRKLTSNGDQRVGAVVPGRPNIHQGKSGSLTTEFSTASPRRSTTPRTEKHVLLTLMIVASPRKTAELYAQDTNRAWPEPWVGLASRIVHGLSEITQSPERKHC